MDLKAALPLVLLAFTSCLPADDKPALEFVRDETPLKETAGPVASYADVLEQATPAVVSVYTAKLVTVSRPGVPPGMEDLLRQFGWNVPPRGSAPPGPREQRQRHGVGSGVIVSPAGYIVTNHHVVTDQGGMPVDEIKVRLSDRREFNATLIGSDEKTDVALLKIEAEEPLPVATAGNSDNIRVGDVVFAIGNPLEVGLTATQGIVSAFGRTSLGILGQGAYENFIQTDAAINLGNSGGALIDARGRLVGINTAIVSRSGGSIGIGFAIPVNMVINVVTNLVERGEVPRGLLGLFPRDLSPELSEAFGLESTRGALVDMVQQDSPAERAGIRHGDVIVRINGIEIDSAPQLRLVVSQMLPGSEVDVHVLRAGKEIVLPVTLGSVDGDPASAEPEGGALEGVLLEPVDNRLRQEFSIPPDVSGVVVGAVAVSSPYVRSLTPGMVVIEANGESVDSPEDVAKALRPGVNRLYVWIGGKRGYVVIRIGED
jgi:serine protease Do/serine protease DegQ